MEIKPIRNERDLRAAHLQIDSLLGAKPGTAEADRLEVLTTLVAAYEAKHHPIGPPTPVGALLFEIDQGNVTRRDLELALGSRARVAEVLNGKRELSKAMILKLHQMFGIPLSSLLAGPGSGKPPRRATKRIRSPAYAKKSKR